MPWPWTLLLLLSALCWSASSCLAQPQTKSDYTAQCGQDQPRDNIPAQDRIEGCTKAIQSAGRSGVELGKMYIDRSEAYLRKQMYAKALADADEAVRLAPHVGGYVLRAKVHEAMGNLPAAIADYSSEIETDAPFVIYEYRGTDYFLLQDYAHAISDYSESVRRMNGGSFPEAMQERALANFASQHYREAMDDMSRAEAICKTEESFLWIYLVRAKGGAEDARATLAGKAASLNAKYRPLKPITGLYLGDTPRESALRESDAILASMGEQGKKIWGASFDPDRAFRVFRCEAQFFVAEWDLLNGNRAAAESGFKSVVEKCNLARAEGFGLNYSIAKTELARFSEK